MIGHQMLAAAQAMSPDQVARMKNQQYVASLKAPAQIQPVKTPYGINHALSPQKPAQLLSPDPRFNQPGPSAEMRPQPAKENL